MGTPIINRLKEILGAEVSPDFRRFIETLSQGNLKTYEGPLLELKASYVPKENDTDSSDACIWNVVKAIIGMANSQGGCILLGIAEDKYTKEKKTIRGNGDPDGILLEREDKDLADHTRKKLFGKSDVEYEGKVYHLGRILKELKQEERTCFIAGKFHDTDEEYPVVAILVEPIDSVGQRLLVQAKTLGGSPPIRETLFFYRKDVHAEIAREKLASSPDSRELTESVALAPCADLPDLIDIGKPGNCLKHLNEISEDVRLDNLIRTYYQKIDQDRIKHLKHNPVFVPLDAEGNELIFESSSKVDQLPDLSVVSIFGDDDNLPSEETDSDEENTFTESEPKRMRLTELLLQYPRVVLTGEPGAGKTTCLCNFVIDQGKSQRDKLHPHLFAFVQMGLWKWKSGGSVRDLVESCCKISQSNIDALIKEKRLHLVLDALNECPDDCRRDALRGLTNLAEKYPDLPIVVSTRRMEGIDRGCFPAAFEVQPMDRDQQLQLLGGYLRDAKKAESVLSSLEKQPGGADIAKNPHMLKMVAQVMQHTEILPSGRAGLYHSWFAELYECEKRKARQADDRFPWADTRAFQILYRMSFDGRAKGHHGWIPLDVAQSSMNDADWSILMRVWQGHLLEIDSKNVRFRHETFQEYLCAEWLLADPASFIALQEKDYDTWGMPIAYAAELSQPGKLPSKLSSAVWKMNPWVASLVSDSISSADGIEHSRPEMVLASALLSGDNLLSDHLKESFRKEFFDGRLFRSKDAPLSYMVNASESARNKWLEFECAYALNIPDVLSESDWVFGKNQTRQRFGWAKNLRQNKRIKIDNMVLLSRGNMIPSVVRCFPEVPYAVIVRHWCWSFSNGATSNSRLFGFSNMANKISTSVAFPIEAISPLIGKLTKKLGDTRIQVLSKWFGDDFIQHTLCSIPANPALWEVTEIFRFLTDAAATGHSVNEAARVMLVRMLETIESLSVSPNGQVLINVKCLCNLLCEEDVPLVLPKISDLGTAILKRVGFNPNHLCEPYYEAINSVETTCFLDVDLNDIVRRKEVILSLINQDFRMSLSKYDINRHYAIFQCPSFPKGVVSFNPDVPEGMLTIGSEWTIHVGVQTRFRPSNGSFFGFFADEIRPYVQNSVDNPKVPCPAVVPRIKQVKQVQPDLSRFLESMDRMMPLITGSAELEGEISRPAEEVKKVSSQKGQNANIGSDQPTTDLNPSFMPTKEKKTTSSSDTSLVGAPVLTIGNDEITRSSIVEKNLPKPSSCVVHRNRPLKLNIYIDEAWPGAQDKTKKDIGVIAGIAWFGSKPNPAVLSFVDTHLHADGREQLSKLLKCEKAMPFAFPIQLSTAFHPNPEKYLELLINAVVLLLGWILPRPFKRTDVSIHAEHFSSFHDGADATESFKALLSGVAMTQNGNRFSNWSIECVEWQNKNYGYIPYGDLVGYLFAETSEAKRMAKDFNVSRWPGCVPFSPDLLPVLRDLDAKEPTGVAGALFRLAGLCGGSNLFRISLKDTIRRAKQDDALRDAILERICNEFANKERDLRRIAHVADAFFESFPDAEFKERPKLRFLRLLANLQKANHDGHPDAVDAALRPYLDLRSDMEKRDLELCLYGDLNMAVHFNDSFSFIKAEELLRSCRNAPSFPFLSARNRGRLLSSLGQSAALMGRSDDADTLFRRALDAFSETGGELVEEADQTRIYRAFAALDAFDKETPQKIAEALTIPIDEAVLRPEAVSDHPFREHLLAKTLWYAQASDARPDWTQAYLSTSSSWTSAPQHPWELILLYRGLLSWKRAPALAARCFDEWDEWFQTVPHGRTLSLIRGFGLVAMKRHCGRTCDNAELEKLLLSVKNALPDTAPTVNALLRIAQDSTRESIDELWALMPFNYK